MGEDYRLSASNVAAFQTCNALWAYKYLEKREPVSTSDELIYGKAWHKALEERAQGVEAYIENFHDDTFQQIPNKWVACGRFLLEHHATYCDDIVVETPEVEFEHNIAGLDLMGYIDGIGTYHGKKVGIEYKTTSSKLDDFYWVGKLTNFQLRLYAQVLREKFPDIEGIAYNVSKSPKYMPKWYPNVTIEKYQASIDRWIISKQESEEVFQTRYIDVTDLEPVNRDLVGFSRLQQRVATLCEPPRNDSACFKFRRQCEYYGVCWEGEDLHDDSLFQVRSRR